MKLKSAVALVWAIAWDVPAAFAAELALKMPAKAASSAVFGLTDFRLGCAPDQDRFPVVAFVDSVGISDALLLSFSVTASQGNVDDTRGHAPSSRRTG